MNISEAKPGEAVWILNGVRNRAFRATVVGVEDEILVVRNDDERNKTHGQLLEFERESGVAYFEGTWPWKGEPPLLVPRDDPRALVIERRRRHKEFRETLNNAANTFNEEPTQEHYVQLKAVVEEWGENSIGRDFKEKIETTIWKEQSED